MWIRRTYLALAAALVAGGWAFAIDNPSRFPVLKTATHHPVQYYVSLPKTWTPDRRWPLVVAIDASYGDFYAEIDRFSKARKDSPFIVVVPFLTDGRTVAAEEQKAKFHYSPEVWRQIETEGPLEFDLAALDAVVEEARTAYGGEEKPFLAGWGQGGGNMVWRLVFTQPERWRAAAAACPRFDSRDASNVSGRPERADLPVRVFQGDSDFLRTSAGLDAEWEKAKQVAEQNGYRNLSRVLIPEKFHDPFADDVMNFFRSVLEP